MNFLCWVEVAFEGSNPKRLRHAVLGLWPPRELAFCARSFKGNLNPAQKVLGSIVIIFVTGLWVDKHSKNL